MGLFICLHANLTTIAAHRPFRQIGLYRTVGVVNRLAARSVTCDNAQLPVNRAAAGQWQLAWAVVID